MKKLIFIILFLVYFLTSIVYLDLYDFKATKNILWQNSSVACVWMSEIRNINTPKELIGVLQNLSQKYDVNISKVSYKKKSESGKRKIKIYTTCNSGAFDNITLSSGRVLQNSDLSNKFISSAKTDSENQLGRVNFFNLSSTLEIYNLSGMLYNGESIGGNWFIDEKDENKLNLIKNDLQEILNCQELEITSLASNEINVAQADEFYHLNRHMISVLILLYVIMFLIFVYWIFSRYKEFAVRKMFGESNIKLKLNIILKEMLNSHAKSLVLTGVLIFSFLIYKLGISNLNLFFKDWLKFNLILSLISLILMFIPMYLIKYIEISLMLKNKKPVKITQKINYVSKGLIGVAAITCIANCGNNLYFLYNKNMENKIWDNSLNYGAIKLIATFSGTVHGRDDEEEVDKLSLKIKNWFKVCNQKGAIYISARNHRVGRDDDEKQMDLLTNIQRDEFSKITGKSIKVNNNYLQLNPIYDINNNKINIPDHDEHTLNLLVPQKFKNFEEKIKEKYTGEFYSNNWPDYKLNIIYIKDNQKCFTYQANWATETQNYVIGSIIQVISNNNMHISSYGSCWCNGFYPKINNIDNPYQDLLPDIKAFELEKVFMSADTLYEVAAKNVYEVEQQFFRTIEYMAFSIVLLIILIVSTCINYFEQNKIKNIIKKLHGEPFIKRNINFIKIILLIWLISILLMFVINYNENIVYKLINWFYLPGDVILLNKLVPGTYFGIDYINWEILATVIILDLIISTIFLKIYENKKISSVLKGE